MTKTQPKQASSMWLWAFGLAFLAGVIGAAIASEDWVFWLLAPPGFVIGLLIALVRRTARLQREIDLLKRQLAELQEKTAASAASEKPPPSATPVSSTEESIPPAPPFSKEPGPPITPPETPPPQPDPWLSSSPAPVPSNTAFEALFQKVIAFFTGDNAVVRIGLLVLFFGVAFLYRYWVERYGIRIELRLILTTLTALAALGWGWRLRRRRPGYALLIQGGAVGVLYITVFAAAKFYQLLPLPLALVLMVALVLLSALLALLQDSMALAVAGTVGGFLAPILTSTGAGSHIQLFSFYAILDLGILAIAWFKTWRPLNLVGFFFTLGIGAVWGRRLYQPEYFATTEPFLILFFLIFSTTAILYAKRQPPECIGYVDSTLIFGTPLAAFTLQWLLVKTLPFAPALSALALAFYYTLLARWLWRQTRETPAFRLLTEAFVAMAAAFATLAVPLALSGRWTSVAWVLEGAALVWVGLRQRRQLSTAAGVVLQLLAGAAFFLGDLRLVADHWLAPSQVSSPPWLDSTWLGAALIGVAGLFSGWLLHREDKPLWEWVPAAKWLLLGWGVIWWLGSGIHEIEQVFQPPTQPAMMLLWLAVSLAAFRWIGHRAGWPALAHTHLALLAVLCLAALGDPEFHHHPLAHGGWLAWPVAWGLWYHGLKRLEAGSLKPYPPLHETGIWLLLFLTARELAWQVDHLLQGQGVWSLLPWALVPMIALWLLGIRRLGQGWPFASVPQAYHQHGLLPVAGWLWLWILLSAIASSGHPDPLPYLPLINPLELTQLTGFLLLVRWWRHNRDWLPAGLQPPEIWIGLGASLFLWLNTVPARAVHYWAGVPYVWFRLLDSPLYQAGLSILWGLLGLVTMVAGSRFGHRSLWQSGLGLYGLTVAKLFLVDLAGQDSLARIIAFLVVGLLLGGGAAPGRHRLLRPPSHAQSGVRQMNRYLQNRLPTLLFSVALLACPSVPASPEQPKPEDFAWGFPVIVDTRSDIYQVTLPESLYRAVASPQLADLRVFDGRGSPVPFLLIPPKADETPPPAPTPVPFFPLYRSREQADPANIRIETARGGAIIHIHNDSANEQNRVLWGYLIDLGKEHQAIRGLKLQWQNAGDNLMTRVRLEQSDDLSIWRPLGTPATVASLRFDGHRIERNQVSFSAPPQRYLRLHWPSGAQGIELVQIHALVSQTRPAPQITWITLKPVGKEEDDGQRHYLYNSGGLFPVIRLQVRLPGDNVLATVRIESRSQPERPWQLRHQGLVYRVSVQGNALVNETIVIPTTSDRTWQLTVTKALGLGDPPPSLQLGWQPHRLRFLASGHPPYLIACGNARMPPLPPSFQHTLKTLLGEAKDVSVATATIGPRQPLGDPSLLSPPRIVPWRRWLLWAVLLLGVSMIALMVRRLVREMRQS